MQYKVFWCKVNKFYTDEWLNSKYLEWKSGIFVASCVVTDKAKRKWIKFVKQEITKLKDSEKIYLSWCWAFEKAKASEQFFEIYSDLKDYKNKIEILWESPNDNISKDPESSSGWQNNKILIDSTKLNKIKWKLSLTTKKFLLIQWWCDSFCTFCLTVIKRWKHFYRSLEDIIDEITEYEMIWGKEVVITWVNLWAWWLNNTNDYTNPQFSKLLKHILEKTEIRRIRISSLWPEFINDELLEICQNKRIYPHFHLSIQSGSSKILKAMRRHYDWEYIKSVLEKLNNLKRDDCVNVSIWADLIVWFPWETESDFKETLNLVEKFNITKLHAFPFSNHTLWEHVPASFYPEQINDKVKKDRLDKLLKEWENIRSNFIKSQIWKTFEVLVENIKNNDFEWWTENYIEINNTNFEVISGKIAKNELIIWKLK